MPRYFLELEAGNFHMCKYLHFCSLCHTVQVSASHCSLLFASTLFTEWLARLVKNGKLLVGVALL